MKRCGPRAPTRQRKTPPRRAQTRGSPARGDFLHMEDQTKSRTDHAVPQPDAAKHLSEKEKRALELQDEVEHTQGDAREQKTKDAGRLGE